MTSGRAPRRSVRLAPVTAWVRGHRLIAALLAVVVVAAAVALAAVLSAAPAVRTESRMVAGTPEGSTQVRLDTTLYLPERTPAPAVLLAHGFGGDKTELAGQARDLARAGYVVLAYTARGFGRSGGLIHLDAPDYEVADARRMIDLLAARSDVQQDTEGDPRVAVAGSSYGGALALLLAGYDKRVDAVAADITWNNLAQALVPNGVFKRLWAAYLFGAGITPGTGSGTDSDGGGAGRTGSGTACGRFARDLCAAYTSLAQGRPPTTDLLGLLAASSPSSILSRITAPVLLTQGEQDSLFPLTEAVSNARGIAAAGTPVKMIWRTGGHDTGGGTAAAHTAARAWFDTVLHGSRPDTDFELALRGAGLSAQSGDRVDSTLRTGAPYPSGRVPRTAVTVSGAAQTINAPAGGTPAAVSALPGLSTVLDLAGSGVSALTQIPGQSAAFDSAPLRRTLRVTGDSSVRLRITPQSTTDATLFVALRDVAPNGSVTLPAQQVVPIGLTGLRPGRAQDVTVRLPAVVTDVEAGHRLRVTVSTTDQLYAVPTDPRSYRIQLAGDQVSVPTIATTTVRTGSPVVWLLVGLGVVVLGLLVAAVAGWRRRRRDTAVDVTTDDGSADVPVVVRDLVKEYRDGYRAVDGVSFTVERGQIVGLLGPNGAGKTTTLRVLMGLIRPTSGAVEVFGRPVRPGSAVLSRVGAFVEGPGLLPHLSGRANLRLYWAASGRPAQEAQFDTALEIAGLGASVNRRVKTYSHGMKQRLAIAQAMLGLPELLVLDEPTNGLDPPQIAEMREVLRSYADTGRTVVVSSHLLGEVEQTCTHVVVMHRGRLVAAGSVAEIAGTGDVTLAVNDPARARAVLTAAGITATEVPARRALEDVFLELVNE